MSYTLPFELPNTRDITMPQIRLLLVGPPNSGKTFSTVTTFPSPTVLDWDHKLIDEQIRRLGIPYLPMYDLDWIKKNLKANDPVGGLELFMLQHAPSFTEDQTLIFDSLSALSDDVTNYLNRITAKEKDGYAFWKKWAEWFCCFIKKLPTLKCHVVVTAHEKEIRDSDTGRVIGYKWLLAGQEFSPRLGSFFTDVYRQVRYSDDASLVQPKPGLDVKAKEKFLWQVKTDSTFVCNTRMHTDNKYVPATFESFKQYMI